MSFLNNLKSGFDDQRNVDRFNKQVKTTFILTAVMIGGSILLIVVLTIYLGISSIL